MSDSTQLDWKSYGDDGRRAKGRLGVWRIVTDGMWWHLNLESEDGVKARRGKFFDRQRAMDFAQEREDGVEIVPLDGA